MKLQFIFLFILTLFVKIGFSQTNILSANGGVIIPLGENTENYDIGYKASMGYEFGGTKNLGIEIEAGYSYIYSEITEYKPFFGLWVDNRMPFIHISPKIILPNSHNSFRFYISPTIHSSIIFTEATIYTLDYNGGTLFSENKIVEKENNLNISFNISSGIDFFVTEKMGVGFDINYHIVNLKDGSTEIPINKQGVDNDKVDIKGLGISAKLLLKL